MDELNQFEQMSATGQLKKLTAGSASILQEELNSQGIEQLRKAFKDLQASHVIGTSPTFQGALTQAASQLIPPYFELISAGQKFAEQLKAGLTQLFEPLQAIKTYLDAIPVNDLKNWADTWSQFNEEFWQQLDQEERDAYALLGRLGLLGVEGILTLPEVRTVVKLQKEQGDPAAQAYILEKLRADDFRMLTEAMEDWYSIPYLADRKRVITSAVNAHKRGEYELSVPTLMPLIDGLCYEISKTLPSPGKKLIKVKHVAQEYSKMEPELSRECLIQVVNNIVFEDVDLRTPCVPSSSSNRHGILHGRVPDYGTELNSYQVLLLLNMVVEMYKKLVPAVADDIVLTE